MITGSTASYAYVGARLDRIDVLEKATGAAVYASDVARPGMLHAKLLRSPYPHARIVRIDTSRAERLPGVKGIVTGRGLPPLEQFHFGTYVKDTPVLARDRVRFIGEEIAAVAAIDPDTAAEAVDLIEVEYEELPAVFDPLEAIEPDAVRLHPRLEEYAVTWPTAIRYGNVAAEVRFAYGDADRDLAESEYVVEGTFRTQSVHAGYLERRVAVAEFDGSGKVTVWCSSQAPFGHAKGIADVCGLPMSKVRVISPRAGGGFGGKLDPLPELYAALLARKTRKPVRYEMSREEEFVGTNPRHPSFIRLRMGATKEGRLTGLTAEAVLDSGAYASHGPAILGCLCTELPVLYKLKSYRVRGRLVYTNKLAFGPFRGYGNPQASFARESALDMLAERAGIDPVEFRLRNAIENGDRIATGQAVFGVSVKECIEQAAAAAGWRQAKRQENGRGLGIACMVHSTGLLGSSAVVRMHEDGSVVVASGATEIGSGQETVLAQIAAEELGVPVGRVAVSLGDTETCPYDFKVGASRFTYSGGVAVQRAAQQVKQQIQQIAAEYLEASPDDLELRAGRVFVKGSPERGLPLRQLAGLAHYKKGGPLVGSGSFLPEQPPLDQAGRLCEGNMTSFWPAWSFAAQIAEVQVDRETGRLAVMWFVAAHDVGQPINPVGVEGQIEGALAQGLGYATSEEIVVRDGRVINPSFVDYQMPSARDVPPITAIIVQELEPTGPFGAKGVGEPGLVPTAPAIANAVYDAVGRRMTDLPMTAEKVLAALEGREA